MTMHHHLDGDYRDPDAPEPLPDDVMKALAAIARREMFIETLETRNSDSLDFYETAVWSMRSAWRQHIDWRRRTSSADWRGASEELPRLSRGLPARRSAWLGGADGGTRA